MEKISEVLIQNYKSIRNQKIDLKDINILIGPNGSGKSNFLNYFNFIEKLVDGQLQDYVFNSGGIETFLFGGYFKSKSLGSEIIIKVQENPEFFYYKFSIMGNLESFKFYDEESGWFTDSIESLQNREVQNLNNYSSEAILKIQQKKIYNGPFIYSFLNGLRAYHFNYINSESRIRLPNSLEDNMFLKKDGENLASFLLLLRDNYFDEYNRIIESVRLVYPKFHDFVLEESNKAKGKILLRWRERGDENIYIASQISDGTLRFICLATLLLQPHDYKFTMSPSVIIIDEPELGLHPFAIHVLAELIRKASLKKQIIIATQSIEMINEFHIDDLIIVERNANGETIFGRKTEKEISEWLNDYTLGEIWESNIIGGRP